MVNVSTPISTNVSLVFGNLILLEYYRSKMSTKKGFFYVVSPWVKDVVFPITEFGINESQFSTNTRSSDIINTLSLNGTDVKICTLDYFSDIVSYKNPLKIYNPAEKINQALKNIDELEILMSFNQEGGEIYLDKNFHSKIIATASGLYKGSFNFTFSGYYKNREDGVFIPNMSKISDDFTKELNDVKRDFFSESQKQNHSSLIAIRKQLETIIRNTRDDWDRLMRNFVQQSKSRTDRNLIRRGITI